MKINNRSTPFKNISRSDADLQISVAQGYVI